VKRGQLSSGFKLTDFNNDVVLAAQKNYRRGLLRYRLQQLGTVPSFLPTLSSFSLLHFQSDGIPGIEVVVRPKEACARFA